MTARRARLLVVHQYMPRPNGADAVSAWVLQALKDAHDVTLLTWDRLDLARLDRVYGTSLAGSDVRVRYPGRALRLLCRLDPDPQSLQPAAAMMRLARRARGNYDLLLGTGMEEMDLGQPSLLYVSYPSLARFWARHRPRPAAPLGTRLLRLARGETRPWMEVADYSVERMLRSRILTNSDWTAAVIRERYGVPARTLYPPVTAPPAPPPRWGDRAEAFACVGSLGVSKRMPWVIGVLGAVRRDHPTLRLHLAGAAGPHPDDRRGVEEVRRLVAANAEWVTLHEGLDRRALHELLSTCRYGIHALVGEHFGIAPAEQLVAGCVVFVHDSGGQVEIVGRDPRLCYADAADAEAKVRAVLRSPELQDELRTALAARRSAFTPGRFVRDLRAEVEACLRGPR